MILSWNVANFENTCKNFISYKMNLDVDIFCPKINKMIRCQNSALKLSHYNTSRLCNETPNSFINL